MKSGHHDMEYEAFKPLIRHVRQLRNFDASLYIQQKIQKLNAFFCENLLDSAVIGISGGIDSAVTFLLLAEASKVKDSPLKKIQALLLPIHGKGTTNQERATSRGMLLNRNESTVSFIVNDLSSVLECYLKANATETSPGDWSIGQLSSILRTPALYFHAALLQQQGYRSIVVGTTNRDEGSYIGFFGKASDAMVDLQPIADLHKSEVYQIAQLLGVPEEIYEAVPSGDVWDGKSDEEMIGAPYWFVELYLLMKEFKLSISSFDESLHPFFSNYAAAIEDIHSQNLHKYRVGNPAHFIDVLPRKISGGW